VIAVDTNVLVRVLTDDTDSPEQTQQARQLVKWAGVVFVPQIVQIELVWVLERAYELEKIQILLALQLLLDSPAYQLQHQTLFAQAIERFRHSSAGFADSLIAIESEQQNAMLWTFDRKLSKQQGVQLLTDAVLSAL
jgi:predicted nucleic-acid-binding protein